MAFRASYHSVVDSRYFLYYTSAPPHPLHPPHLSETSGLKTWCCLNCNPRNNWSDQEFAQDRLRDECKKANSNLANRKRKPVILTCPSNALVNPNEGSDHPLASPGAAVTLTASAVAPSTIFLRFWPVDCGRPWGSALFYPARGAPLQSGLPPVGVL